MAKNLYVIAGPNGAGKTTFANKFLPDFANCEEFINADLIARGLAPFAPESMAMKATFAMSMTSNTASCVPRGPL